MAVPARGRTNGKSKRRRKPRPPFLSNIEWEVGYSHEDGDLVRLFYNPVLSCAKRYRRATGYFSAGALALAARGLDALMARKGMMELLVGCTLGAEDIQQIKEGYDLREHLAKRWKVRLNTEEPVVSEHLGYLAYMIAHGFLDVKLAVPLDEHGQMRAGLGLYHAKMGIVEDDQGQTLTFKGSINETEAGWLYNCESFEVSCSWRGEWESKKVEKTYGEFETLWTGRARSAKVVEFPDALKERLLEYLPKDDTSTGRPKPKDPPEEEEKAEEEEAEAAQEPEKEVLSAEERRQRAWSFIRDAPKRPDGAMVAVVTSTVKPWPHQLRAYKRMLDNWPFRLLVADEVGLGKTIEAGLLIRHVWISGLAKRILILAPKAILKQWQAELYEKFNLLVPIYTGQALAWPEHHFRQCPLAEKVGRGEWTKQPLVLASSQLMRRRERQGELVEADDWDLLVLDEAHHARRGGAGTPQEKGPNHLLRLMRKIKDKAKALLLMTATPMQVHPVEIWDLLDLLGLPEAWTEQVFVDYFETLNRNPGEQDLHRLARLFQAAEATYGPLPEEEADRDAANLKLSKIDRKKVLGAVREPHSTIPFKRLTAKQRKAAVAVLKRGSPVRFRMSRHTRHLLRKYHEKGLLDEPIAKREVEDVPVQLTPPERQLYDDVEDYISHTYQAADPDKRTAVGFVMTIYRRRLASSFHALRQTLQDRLARLGDTEEPILDSTRFEEDAPQDERADEVLSGDEAAELAQGAASEEERGSIQTLLKAIAKLGTDTKARVLVEKLKEVFENGYDSALIFTQYTDTVDYLKAFLAERFELPIGTFCGRGGERRDFSGSWTRCSKEDVKRMLVERKIRILVCNDAAGEGLNLQSCGVLVNYDLPWNPMKVEQRIGRIDRIGQNHPVVRIINLAYADTVEADVYFALSKRIDLFLGVVGKLQPILSRLPKEFENAALVSAGERERSRHQAVQNVHTLVDEAEAGAFDIDEVSEDDLRPPAFPPSPVNAEDLDLILRHGDLLPPGVECQELESGTYSLRVPGQTDAARVTTRPGIFDTHFENHQLLWADSPLYRQMVAVAGELTRTY